LVRATPASVADLREPDIIERASVRGATVRIDSPATLTGVIA
jgi:hypothetical protein